MKSVLTKSQFKTDSKEFTQNGERFRIRVKIRYDDQCNNGHNTFSITGTIDILERGVFKDYSSGCIHEEISKHFPELKKFIKWHLVSSDEPLHYIANTVYLAGDKDYNGLRKGEKKQIRNGRTGKLCWILEAENELPQYVDSNTRPKTQTVLKYVPLCNVGKGKERQLEAARKTAIWPDATIEQLTDEKALRERLPALMKEFKAAVEELGFIY